RRVRAPRDGAVGAVRADAGGGDRRGNVASRGAPRAPGFRHARRGQARGLHRPPGESARRRSQYEDDRSRVSRGRAVGSRGAPGELEETVKQTMTTLSRRGFLGAAGALAGSARLSAERTRARLSAERETTMTAERTIGMSKWDLDTPALCVDLDKME